MFQTFIFALSLICVLQYHGLSAYRVETEEQALKYLTYYGYVDPEVMPKGFTMRDCNKKLKEFQKLSRVPVTGIVDQSTLKAMNTPRCGCPDFIHLSYKGKFEQADGDYSNDHHYHHPKNNHTFDHSRHHHHHHHHRQDFHRTKNINETHGFRRNKRYVVSNSRWDKKVISYDIVRYPSRSNMRVSAREIEDAVHKAFSIWGQHINLEFSYQPNDVEVDIELSFMSAYHGDDYPFDGPGKTLAHAFFPGTGIGGDVHFEQDEDWRVGTYGGIDLLYVAVHELGHSLGLGHSSDYGAIMYPMYRGYQGSLQLHLDDVRGVQELYGSRQSLGPTIATTTSTTTSKPKTTTSKKPKPTSPVTTTVKSSETTTENSEAKSEVCFSPKLDAITTMFGQHIMVFKGDKVYEIGNNGEGVLPGWPKDISNHFRGLENNLDCAMTRSNGKTYFFKGAKYWRFTGRRMDRGYPRSISEYFPSIQNNLDAAFEWDEEFVFAKGNQFWRFNTRKRPQVQNFFPMPLGHWGLHKKLDAALTAPNGTVYFFQDEIFWEFDKESHKINHSDPQLVSEGWFGCTEP